MVIWHTILILFLNNFNNIFFYFLDSLFVSFGHMTLLFGFNFVSYGYNLFSFSFFFFSKIQEKIFRKYDRPYRFFLRIFFGDIIYSFFFKFNTFQICFGFTILISSFLSFDPTFLLVFLRGPFKDIKKKIICNNKKINLLTMLGRVWPTI